MNPNQYNVLDIPSNTKYWFIRANSKAQYYEDFKLNNYIAVDSNSLSLKRLLDIPETLRSSKDAVKEEYKQYFQENDLKIFEQRIKKEDLSETIKKKEKTAELKRSANRANRVFNFVEEIKIGDFVVIPYKSAERFLIGTVISDCFEKDIEHIEDLDENNESTYPISDFEFKRRILWIKEIPKNKFPDKLAWIENAHQSLFNITKYGNEINPCITPIYKYKEKIYARMGVNTTSFISSSSWLEYQLTMKSIVGENLDNVFQKQYVQSPGQIILYVEENLYWLLPLILSCLFGNVKFGHGDFEVRFQGVFRFFSKSGKRERQLDLEEKEAKINNVNADTLAKLNSQSEESKELEKKIIESVSDSIDSKKKEKETKIRFSEKISKKEIDYPKSMENVDNSNIKKKFKLSNEDIGSVIQYESQKDNLIFPEDKFEKEEEK